MLKDLKSKIEKLENLLHAKADTPAQWALDKVRTDIELMPANYRMDHTEEEIYQKALELTQRYGTRENCDKAFLEDCRNFDHIGFKAKFQNPWAFQQIPGRCDICEAELTDINADFCQGCHERYPEKIKQIVEYRMQKKCGGL